MVPESESRCLLECEWDAKANSIHGFSGWGFRREILSPAEEPPERIEHAARECTRFRSPVRRLLCKRPLRTAMHLTCNSWYLVDWQIDVVSGTGRRATGSGELVCNRGDRLIINLDFWLQPLRQLK